MKLLKSIRLYSLLARLTQCSNEPHPDPLVVEQQGQTPAGTSFDIYRNRRKTLAACIAIHGVTINGGRDWRLINFARSLAHFGVACVVPTFKNLASCRWETHDLDELANIVSLTADEHHQPVGLIGFSFGGSYALVVASQPEVSERIRWVITFSAYYDLKDVLEKYMKDLDVEPHNDEEWDGVIYRKLAFIYGHQDMVSFPPEVWQEMKLLARRYCCEASIEEKRDFYDRHLHNLDIAEMFKRSLVTKVFKTLSPAGSIDGLKCPVTLIHDRNDGAVPAVHAERLFSELQALPGNNRHQLVITSLLSHVSPANFWKVHEILQFANAFAPLIQ
jgi:pimeloyl-ACP methyl ester carboxylesterase